MIRIGKLPAQPYWVDIATPAKRLDAPGEKGAFLKVSALTRPVETAAMAAAMAAVPRRDQDEAEEAFAVRAQQAFHDLGFEDLLTSLSRLSLTARVAALSDALQLRALALALLHDWQGLGDEDGNPLAFSVDLIPAVLTDADLAGAFSLAIRAPAALLEREKNG